MVVTFLSHQSHYENLGAIHTNKQHIWEKVQNVWTIESESVKKLKDTMDPEAIAAAIEIIVACKNSKGRVVTTGAGTSGVAAKKITHTLSCVEIPSLFMSPADAVHGAMGALQQGDVFIAISKGGNTEEIVKLIPAIKAKGAKLIGVTENEKSKLGQASDVVLKVAVEKEPDPFNMLATASTMAVIATFDAMAVALMEITGYKREQFAIIHPGGAVGERLLNKEGDK